MNRSGQVRLGLFSTSLLILVSTLAGGCANEQPERQPEKVATTRAALAPAAELGFRITGVRAPQSSLLNTAPSVNIRMRTSWDDNTFIGGQNLYLCGTAVGPTFGLITCNQGGDALLHPYPEYADDHLLDPRPDIYLRTETSAAGAQTATIDVDFGLSPTGSIPNLLTVFTDSSARFRLTYDIATGVVTPAIGSPAGAACGFRRADGTTFGTCAQRPCLEGPQHPECRQNCLMLQAGLGVPGENWEICYAIDVCIPEEEVFDGADNDCDGVIDDCAPPQTSWDCTVSNYEPVACNSRPGRVACSPGGAASQCIPFEPIGVDTVCNNRDDDCDGHIDDNAVGVETGVTCGVGACVAREVVSACVNGQVSTSCTPATPGPAEIVFDGIDNDCDGLVDECAPGNTDWRCCSNTGVTTLEFNVVPNNPINSDPIPAPACVPLSIDPNATCSMRGVFQVVRSVGDNACTVIGHVQRGTYPVAEELRLDRGRLRLLGVDDDPFVARVTTTASCADLDCAPCVGNDCVCTNILDCTCQGPDCVLACEPEGECGRNTCSQAATHRLVNAIFARDRPAAFAATSLFEISGLTFDGGQETAAGGFSSGPAAGGIVADGGTFIGRNVIIADNRARGHGAGLAVYNAPLFQLTDSVVRDNLNMQQLRAQSQGLPCHAGIGGGLTGFSGGVHSSGNTRTEITGSAILRNTASDGGGMTVVGGALTMVNNTVSGNTSGGRGGGILMISGTNADLRFNTIAQNTSGLARDNVTPIAQLAGGGISIRSGTLSAFGNVLAKNRVIGNDFDVADDCQIESPVTVGPHGFNLIGVGGLDCIGLGPAEVGTLIGGANLRPLDPVMGDLTPVDLGSRDQVHALQTGSPAIDAYPQSNALPAGVPACPQWDQRSFLRPATGRCDLGSFEVEGVADPDHDGIASELDLQPLLFSNAFSDAASFGITSGTITDRGNQTVVVTDAPGLQNGVLVAALAGGGAAPARISACNGTVQATLQSGQSTTITCPEAAHSCLFASQALTIQDRSDAMSDFFGGSFSFGFDMVASGNGFSSGNGFLNSRSTILQNATLAGVLSGNRAGVKGILRERASVPAQSISVRTGTSSGADLTVAGGTSSSMAPGAYGNVVVQSGATLVLPTSGLYRFKSLEFEPDTRLSILGGSDLTVLAVDGNLTFGDRFRMDSGGGPRLQQSQVLFYTNGAAATIGFDAFIAGSLAAPSALVTLRDRSYFSGCVGGRNVAVGFDATVGSGAPVRMCDATNRVNNPGFESGTAGWAASTGAVLTTTTSRFHGGARSGSVTNRTSASQGAVYNLLSTAPQGAAYDVSVWAEPSTSTSQPLTLSARIRCNGGTDQITQLAQTTGGNTAWKRLSGVLTVPNCALGALDVTVAGPPGGVGLFIDDASVVQRCQ